MHNVDTFSTEWGGRTLTIETGKLAGLANGAARVQYGDTVVLATVILSSDIRDDVDYFPLMVDYEEKLYAAGKIKGSRFIKREGRPTDDAIVNARITDRTLRPLFDQRIRNDIQVVVTVLSVDEKNDPAYVGLIAASAAVVISDIPAEGPAVGLTVAYLDNNYILNPTPEQREQAQFYMFGGVRDGKLVMMEGEGNEAPEGVVLGAIEFSLENGKSVVDLINDMQKKVGKEKMQPPLEELTPEQKKLYKAVESKARPFIEKNVEALFGIVSKQERYAKEEECKEQLKALFETEEEKGIAKKIFNELYEAAFRSLMLDKGIRVDGRSLDAIRDVYTEVDSLPRTHGSALFQRGETQVMSIVTLGAPGDAQIIDGLEPEYTKRYMHHYNFPPFSVGEARPLRGPSRRDIGHGFLAEKALEAMIPPKEEFPYTIRVVSEVLMSNGSSSQASACGSSLALMAAGVPIKNPVAGIAMGLVMNEDQSQYKVLTDIQGVEDHSGDMDFKIAGTKNGVTAIQLDIKLGGITMEICKDTLEQAKQARLSILENMLATIPEPRKELSPYAPRIEIIQIDPERIGELIGPGGKVINGIIDETGVEIDIEEDGNVFITSKEADMMEKAKQMIQDILKEIEVGEQYEGEVIQIIKDRMRGNEIGAIVNLGGGHDGMLHVSQICHGRVELVSSVLKIGDVVKVVVKEVDKEKGRISLSRKDLITPGDPDPICRGKTTTGGGGRGDFPTKRGGDRYRDTRGGDSSKPRPPKPPTRNFGHRVDRRDDDII